MSDIANQGNSAAPTAQDTQGGNANNNTNWMDQVLAGGEADGIEPEEQSDAFGPTSDEPEEWEEESETPVPRKFKLKVNKDIHEASEEQVVEYAQKFLAAQDILARSKETSQRAQQELQQAQRRGQAIGAFVQAIRTGNIEVIEELAERQNLPLEKIVIGLASKYMERDALDPSERRAMDLEKQLKRMQAEQQRQQQAAEQRKREYMAARAAEHIEAEMPDAIKAAGLPNTTDVKRRILELWGAALEAGFAPTAKQIAAKVKQERQALGILSREEIEDAIKVLKSSKRPPTVQFKPKASSSSSNAPKQYIRESDYNARRNGGAYK